MECKKHASETGIYTIVGIPQLKALLCNFNADHNHGTHFCGYAQVMIHEIYLWQVC